MDLNKRKRDEEIYSSYKRLKPTIPLLTGRSFRGSRPSYRKTVTSRSKSYRRYKGPYTRGPAASINTSSPELKSLLTDVKFMPISFGNSGSGGQSYPTPIIYEWNGATTNPFTHWTGTNQSSALIPVNQVATGGALSQRIGRTIYPKSLLVQATWRYDPSAASTTPASIRTMVVWDKQPNNNLPVITDILEPVAFTALQYGMPTSPNNLAFRDRFKTLWDCHDTLNPQGDALREYDKYIPLKNLRTVFSTNAGADASITSGAIYILLITDQFQTDRPWCRITARFRYTDQ